jgi:hypothetical protein
MMIDKPCRIVRKRLYIQDRPARQVAVYPRQHTRAALQNLIGLNPKQKLLLVPNLRYKD